MLLFLAIKNDGFNGVDGTCYDPEIYKKSDKSNIEPIYSAGNETAHFLVSSSDVEQEDQGKQFKINILAVVGKFNFAQISN